MNKLHVPSEHIERTSCFPVSSVKGGYYACHISSFLLHKNISLDKPLKRKIPEDFTDTLPSICSPSPTLL